MLGRFNISLWSSILTSIQNPFLMHAILTLTLMHDRQLSSSTGPLSATEAYHWHQCLALFNVKLSGPIEPSDRDALWATAMCLGIIGFFYVDADTPTEVWPLKEPSETDLNWLCLTEGKRDVWKAAGPCSSKGVFDKPFPTLEAFLPAEAPDLSVLPPELISFCQLDISLAKDNPYLAVAMSLARIFNETSTVSVVFGFLTLSIVMSPCFKDLLHAKDPRALMLLAYWFAKLCQYPHWWLSRRAWLEGQSICLYLEIHCSSEPGIQKLLEFPTSIFDTFNG